MARRRAVIGLSFTVILGMAAGGIFYARHIYRLRKWEELPTLLELLLPFGFVVWFVIRKRIQTGKWIGTRRTPEQGLQYSARYKTRRTFPQTDLLSVARSVLIWARSAAFEPSHGLWQRAVAWIILIGNIIFLLAVAAFGFATINLSFEKGHPPGQRLLFVCLGLWSVYFIYKNVQLLLRHRPIVSTRAQKLRGGIQNGDADGIGHSRN